MPARFRLTYFNGRARAELIRLIFHATGEEFEDNRIDTGSWQQLKPNTPFGALPILEFDGQVLAQSLAIARFLAREFSVAGNSRFEEALVDSVVDTSNDILGFCFSRLESADLTTKFDMQRVHFLAQNNRGEQGHCENTTVENCFGDIIKIIFNEDDKLKKENQKKFADNIFPFTLNSLENVFAKYGKGSGYVIGPNLTVADLAIFNALDQAVQAGIVNWQFFDKYKHISGLLRRLEETPRLANYLKTRPHTPY